MERKNLEKWMRAGLLTLSILAFVGCGKEENADAETAATEETIVMEDYAGTYAGEKYIEAMGCDIAVEITLEEDGTFSYYRAPMAIQMEGGGEMPELTDEGTFEMEDGKILFTAEVLGEYAAAYSIKDDTAVLTGKIPTGGASTDMELVRE
ncbi:MAG: hypothetical protein U0L05_07525 [Schaedlerella sp.]|nr:hypothetical protein [Schaedlerella sp.]